MRLEDGQFTIIFSNSGSLKLNALTIEPLELAIFLCDVGRNVGLGVDLEADC